MCDCCCDCCCEEREPTFGELEWASWYMIFPTKSTLRMMKLTDVLKANYLPALREQLNTDLMLLHEARGWT